jgi:hypothetical protein
LDPRIRLLIADDGGDQCAWAEWQAAHRDSPHSARIVLQRVLRSGSAEAAHAVGLGYGETLRWVGPIDNA